MSIGWNGTPAISSDPTRRALLTAHPMPRAVRRRRRHTGIAWSRGWRPSQLVFAFVHPAKLALQSSLNLPQSLLAAKHSQNRPFNDLDPMFQYHGRGTQTRSTLTAYRGAAR